MKKNKQIIVNIISLSFFLMLWQVISYFKIINPLFLSSPLAIFAEGYSFIKTGYIFPYFLSSMEFFLLGLSLSAISALVLGFLIGTNERLLAIFDPYIQSLNSLPLIAVVPLLMIWFGIGLNFKIAAVFILSFTPMIINVIAGIKNTDKKLIRMAKSFGASKFYIIKNVVFYSTLPFIFSGLKISVGRAVVAMVIADLFGRSTGLGYLVVFYGMGYQTAKLMFVVFVLFMINFFLIYLINKTSQKMLFWQK